MLLGKYQIREFFCLCISFKLISLFAGKQARRQILQIFFFIEIEVKHASLLKQAEIYLNMFALL